MESWTFRFEQPALAHFSRGTKKGTEWVHFWEPWPLAEYVETWTMDWSSSFSVVWTEILNRFRQFKFPNTGDGTWQTQELVIVLHGAAGRGLWERRWCQCSTRSWCMLYLCSRKSSHASLLKRKLLPSSYQSSLIWVLTMTSTGHSQESAHHGHFPEFFLVIKVLIFPHLKIR